MNQKARSERTLSEKPSEQGDGIDLNENQDAATSNQDGATSNHGTTSEDMMGIVLRVELLEPQLLSLLPNKPPALSSSSLSVLVSLRWTLLKALEKPLQPVQLFRTPDYGLTRQEINVVVQCEHQSFRKIAAVFAKEHRCTSNSNNTRVLFSPAFQTTQCGSSASNNFNISFSTPCRPDDFRWYSR